MRITRLEVQGFRGFASTHVFDLDADAVVVVGANGQGKTSFFDAILWALTGRVDRIGDAETRVTSMYSSSGTTRVRLDVRDSSDVDWRIARAFDGQVQQFLVERDGQVMEGQAAFTALLGTMWPEALRAEDGAPVLTAAITRSVYMQQDLVRQFVDADDAQQRFSAVGELVGAGRVTELQLQLERARNAWSRATTQKSSNHASIQAQVTRLEEQLRRLGSDGRAARHVSEEQWAEWWASVRNYGIGNDVYVPQGSPGAPQALDSALRRLEVFRQSAERRSDELASAIRDLADEPELPIADERRLNESVQAAERHHILAREQLHHVELLASEYRRAQVGLTEQRERLKALAMLALGQLGQQCPVCAQEYNVEATRTRLQALLDSGSELDLLGTDARLRDVPDVDAAAATAARYDRELADAQAELRRVSAHIAYRQEWLDRRDRRARELGLAGGADVLDTLTRAADEVAATISRVVLRRSAGEELALVLTEAAEVTRRMDVARDLESARQALLRSTDMIVSREATGELATQLINGLREAASEVVQEKLSIIEPLLQRIYSGIDPHPSFQIVRLLTRFSRGHGHLATQLEDREAELQTDMPVAVLSSSQMNALALSIFLALNLGVPRLPLQALLLDDPLQSLDDINLLGIVDLLRRVKDQRQVIVSTHDARLGGLLTRKLRPSGDGRRTRLIELGSWDRTELSVHQRDIYSDPIPLRIIA